MPAKLQTRWAIVGCRGFIRSDMIRYSRKSVIADVIREHRGFMLAKNNGEGLTDAQFWRRIKRKRGYTVRRVSLRVVR